MERMTLREAAEKTSRSITTLRRYIRSGRLHAEKRYGRFGPEYFVSAEDLASAGLEIDPAERNSLTPPASGGALEVRGAVRQPLTVPLALFQELQMKHEQLLVQYGMIRASGIRALEMQGSLETGQRKIEELEAEIKRRERQDGTRRLQAQLRKAHLELEGRALEIAALKSKVKALEMLTRNAVTSETIDRQFESVSEQTRRVQRITAERRADTNRGGPTDH